MIFGSNGQLGTALSNLFDEGNINYLGLDFPEIDLTKSVTYYDKIISYEPNVLINCSAYTNVNKAESEIENAMKINGTSLLDLVELCNEENIYLVHISTDYVFSGKKEINYREEDTPDPVNIYGITKYVGEKIVQQYSKNYAIIRTSALYGESELNSTNVIKKMISIAKEYNRIKLVDNEYTSPTYAYNLAEQILVIIENNIKGIIHASSEGVCNWVEFGEYLFSLLDMKLDIVKVKNSVFNVNVEKPTYSELNNTVLIKNNCCVMDHWKKSLSRYLERVNKNGQL